MKNRGAQFRNLGRGIADEASRATRRGELDTLRNELGMYQATGITLHAQQQGGGAEVNEEAADTFRFSYSLSARWLSRDTWKYA